MDNESAPKEQYVGNPAAMQVPAMPSPQLDKRRAINAREAAELVGVTLRTLRRYAELGLVPGAYRVGTGHWRYKRRELLDWWMRLDQSNVLRSRFQRRRRCTWKGGEQ
jgi:excisionase family DNA binding protein